METNNNSPIITGKKPLIVTRPCTRCGGSGHYSFNLRDGTICYGCGGRGTIPCAPEGQAKITPTAESLDKAHVGDIVSVACVLYQVVTIHWRQVKHRGFDSYNQTVTCIRLVDGERKRLMRGYFALDMEGFANGFGTRIDGVLYPSTTFVNTPPEMIGQPFDDPVSAPVYDIVTEEQGVAIVKHDGRFAIRQRNENGLLVYAPGAMKTYARQSGAVKAMKGLISLATEQPQDQPTEETGNPEPGA